MDAERLLLARCKQLAVLVQSNDEVELLDMASLIRQLLFDQHSLTDSVNKGRNKVNLMFHVGDFSYPPDQYVTLMSLEDGIDPHTRRPGSPSLSLSRKRFQNHVIAHGAGQQLTIMEAIKFAANVAGGRHHDPYPKDKDKIIASLSKQHRIGGLPFGVRLQKAIARVVLRALDPLIQDVQSRAVPPG